MKIRLDAIQRCLLYIYFFSLNFQIFNLLGLGTPARLFGFLYILAILPQLNLFVKVSNISSVLIKIFLFFSLLTLISALNINYYSYSFLNTTILLNILFFWFLINHERKDPGVLMKGFFSFALGSFFLSILYKLGIGTEVSGGRLTIFGDNANAIALRMSISAIVLTYLAINDDLNLKKSRFFLLIPLPILFEFMLQTGSRKAFIALAIAFVLCVFMHKSKRMVYKVLGFGVSVAAGFYFYKSLMASEVLYLRLVSAIETGETGRNEIWDNVISIFISSPVSGVGMSGYHEAYMNIAGTVVSPHNVLLEVLVYTGIVGFILYISFLFSASFQAFLVYRKYNYLLPLLLLVPVFAMITGGQALGGKIPWSILALSVSTVFYTKKMVGSSRSLPT